jgi:hypothetical protein
MACKIAYHVGRRPGRLTRWLTGMLSIDETGISIDGPAPYRADFSEIHWLGVPGDRGSGYIGIGSSPPVFLRRIRRNLFGFILVIAKRANRNLYAQLHERVGGPERCAVCGCDLRLPGLPCPQCAMRRNRLRLIAACELATLLGLYVGSYYHLSRRGMQEAKQYNMRGFLYVPAGEVFETQDLSGHYFRMRLYAPVNWLDRTLFGSEGPVVCILFGLSKQDEPGP